VSYTADRDAPLLDETPAAERPQHAIADHAVPHPAESAETPVESTRTVELRPIEPDDGSEATVADELWRDQDRLHSELSSLRRDLHGLYRNQERQQVEQLHQATELLQQMQQSSKLQDLELKIRDLEQQGRERETRAPSKARRAGTAEEADSSFGDDGAPTDDSTEIGADEDGDGSTSLVRPHPGATDRYDVRVSRAPVGEVLGRLAKLAGRSLVVDSRARGSITARLENVTFEEALQALTRAGRLAVESDGRTMTVTSVDAARPATPAARVEARVLRMRHIDPDEFRRLIEPLLTPQVGRVSRAATAEESTGTPHKLAGDHFDGRGTVVVTDVPETLARIEHMLRELDLPPRQVVIEARVLSVKLTDETRFGVNFAVLGATDGPSALPEDDPLIVPAGHSSDANFACPPGVTAAGTQREGLRQATVQANIPQIVNALERIGDTSVIASPRLVTLNNRAAELGIGERTGYRTLVASGSGLAPLDFIETGTRLRIHPVITGDGYVRLDVQPKRSTSRTVTGRAGKENALPSVQFADLSTHVLLREGETAILGGIIEEQVRETATKVPVLGSLPVVGTTFRTKTEQTERSELIVLLTARVVEDGQATTDLDEAAGAAERRHQLLRDMQSPAGRRNAARRNFERARTAFLDGRVLEARHYARDALQLDKTNPRIVELHDQIERAARYHSQPVVPAAHVIPAETPWEPSFAPPRLPTFGAPSTSPVVVPEHLPPVEYSASPVIDRRAIDPSLDLGTEERGVEERGPAMGGAGEPVATPPARPAPRGPILPGTGTGALEYPGARVPARPTEQRDSKGVLQAPRREARDPENNPPAERAAAALGPALPPPESQ
jgi:type IV pilus assembly protein PilQ